METRAKVPGSEIQGFTELGLIISEMDGRTAMRRVEFPEGTQSTRAQARSGKMITLWVLKSGLVLGRWDPAPGRPYRSLFLLLRSELNMIFEVLPDAFRGILKTDEPEEPRAQVDRP